jgi:Tfp pilus assembly protein PilV
MNQIRRSHQSGFTLLEALISLLVMAFGMLALASMQFSLSRNSDLAKQRTEAVRLAEERIERMRSFVGISTGTINWNALPASVETLTSASAATLGTNTTFTVTPTVGGATADPMRPISVAVTWVDRTNVTNTVTVSSVISKSDPSDSGFLGNPLPQNTKLLRPKNRNLNIPIPGISLPNGITAYNPSANLAIVFSDISANVVTICTHSVNNSADLAAGCTSLDAYSVSGYVTGSSAAIAAVITGMNYGGLVDGAAATSSAIPSPGIKCAYGRARDQNTGVLLAANQYFYICVVPLSSSSNPASTWSGKLLLGGIPIGSSDKYWVCRYQYSSPSLSSNASNVQPYDRVTETIDLQNYFIDSGNTVSCPTATNGTTVVLHQDCRNSNANKATDCPAASTYGAL